MSPNSSWLPALLLLEDFGGDWAAYRKEALRIFERDFGGERPDFRGKRMGMKRQPLIEGMPATFWHLISEGTGETERIPDLRRCERIAWPLAILKSVELDGRVLVWDEEDPRRGPKVLLALPDFSYLVVVDDRGDFVLLWTAYPVEREHQRKKLAKRYHDAQTQKS